MTECLLIVLLVILVCPGTVSVQRTQEAGWALTLKPLWLQMLEKKLAAKENT